MHALDLGCQVIAFDAQPDAVNRVVQTLARARDAQGRLMLESFHGYTNVLGCVVNPAPLWVMPPGLPCSKRLAVAFVGAHRCALWGPRAAVA